MKPHKSLKLCSDWNRDSVPKGSLNLTPILTINSKLGLLNTYFAPIFLSNGWG